MNSSLGRFPIQRKLRLVILFTCFTALCVVCSALFGLEFYLFQRDFRRDLVAVGEIVASNSTAVLKRREGSRLRSSLSKKWGTVAFLS